MKSQDIKSSLVHFNKLKTASLVAGLLLDPKFHSNTLRIETLLLHIVSDCSGDRIPTSGVIKSWLNEFEPVSRLNYLEDPVEDTFVSRVATGWGDYRVYGGIWEGYGFYLQRILNVIETIPSSLETQPFLTSVKALLTLSEEIANRNEAKLHLIAESQDKDWIIPPKNHSLHKRANSLSLSENEVRNLGFTLNDLTPFVLQQEGQKDIKSQDFGLNNLLRHPLISEGNSLVVILPTAITWALRFYIFEWLESKGLIENFYENFILEYVNFLRNQRQLGKFIPPGIPKMPVKMHDAYFLEFAGEIDSNRYLHLLIQVDTLTDLNERGINQAPASAYKQSEEIDRRIERARVALGNRSGFREGMSLVIQAGYGRGNYVNLLKPQNDWSLGVISSSDLETMIWTPGASDKTIWKFIKHQHYLENIGIEFQNANGLLNLYGWWEDSDHMFVPSKVHFGGTKRQILVIPTNCIAKVRQKALRAFDHRTALYIDRTFKQIRKKHLSTYFEEDAGSILYVSYSDVRHRKLIGCALTKKRPWWLSISEEKGQLNPENMYGIWDALHNWMGRIAPILDKKYPNIKEGPLLYELDMSRLRDYNYLSDMPHETRKGDLVNFEIDAESDKIILQLNQPFIFFLHYPTNKSEKALIKACVEGFIKWGGITTRGTEVKEILYSIIPNTGARFMHLFEAKKFRETIKDSNDSTFEEIDNSDLNILKVGLGHFNNSEERRITDKKKCTTYINDLVDHLSMSLRNDLKKFNRASLVKKFFLNIEGVASNRGQWERTMKAVFDLRKNKGSVMEGKAKYFMKLHASDIANRILIEMAISESPLDEGIHITNFDMSPLMAKALLIFRLGNISDGINKNVILPNIHVMPNGEVLTDQSFQENIFQRMASNHENEATNAAIDSYEDNYPISKEDQHTHYILEQEFLTAFEAEFGVSVENLKMFLQQIEDIGYEKDSKVFQIRRSEIVRYTSRSKLINEVVLKQVLNVLSLKPRTNWDEVPVGFTGKDIYPWLFRRRMSLLMKPLVITENSDDPQFIISPGFLAESLIYIIDIYKRCGIEADRCNSNEMKKWVGNESDRKGRKFTAAAAAVIKQLGYYVKTEVNVSTIFPKSLLGTAADHGDFDIIAWKKNKVYLIECKNLQSAKTFKEAAEQLQEFKGEIRNGKQDSLKKHLNRIEIAKTHKTVLSKYCNLGSDISISSIVLFSKSMPVLYNKVREDVEFRYLEDVKENGLA